MTSYRSRVRRYCSLASLAAAAAATLPGCPQALTALEPASPDAKLVSELAWWMFTVGALILFVTLGLLLVGIGLQRRGPSKLTRGRAIALVLGGGVVAPFIAVAAISASGLFISRETEARAFAEGPTVEVVGHRWWWEFRYLDDTGTVTATTANELHLPVGQRSRLRLISDNVIHSFWAPDLQGKTDLVPGRVNTLFAEPAVAGEWQGQCAEFCGLQHAMMSFLVTAQPPDEFAEWLSGQAAPAQADQTAGTDVFFREGCAGCHTVRGVEAVGVLGPDLTHLASRRTIGAARLPNTRENLRLWITEGQSVKPGNVMPEFQLPQEDMDALLDFLGALE